MIAVKETRRGRCFQKPVQPHLPLDQREPAQILAIQEQEIEGVKHQPSLARLEPILQSGEIAEPALADDNRFAIEISGRRVQMAEVVHQRRELLGPILGAAGQELDRAIRYARMKPIAIEFDLMQPLVTRGRAINSRGQLRFDESRGRCGLFF